MAEAIEDEKTSRFKALAYYAAALAQEPNFLELMKHLKNETIAKWSGAKSPGEREACWHDLQALGRLEYKLADLPQRLTLQKVKDATRTQRK
jgi:hypothetical protein